MLHQPVDVLNLHAGPSGNAATARTVDQAGHPALPGRHGVDNRHLPPHLLVGVLRRHGAVCHLRRQLIHEGAQPPHAADLLQLGAQIGQIKALARGDLTGQTLGLTDLDIALYAFDQRHDIAHAEDALRHALGIEQLQSLAFLTHAEKNDGFARHFPYRQGGATARVAIGLGEDNTGEFQSVAESAGRIERVLARHGVDHE